MSEKDTGKIVTFELDLDNPPPLTDEQWEQLERLRTMKDEDIDLSDIPEQTGVEKMVTARFVWRSVGRLRQAALKEKVFVSANERCSSRASARLATVRRKR